MRRTFFGCWWRAAVFLYCVGAVLGFLSNGGEGMARAIGAGLIGAPLKGVVVGFVWWLVQRGKREEKMEEGKAPEPEEPGGKGGEGVGEKVRGEMLEWLRELELEAGADFGAVRRAYRDLVQVWHPDRFGGNEKLQERAQEKLKRINLAYEGLRGVMEAEKAAPPPMPSAPASPPPPPPPPPPPKATEPERPRPEPGVAAPRVSAEIGPVYFFGMVAVFVVVLVVVSQMENRPRLAAPATRSGEAGTGAQRQREVLEIVNERIPSKPVVRPPVVADLKVLDVGLPGGEVMRFCYCPPGQFAMGSPVGEPGHYGNENQVSVTISQGFWMAETEVTQVQWQSVMGTNPSNFKGASLPVDRVSWEDAQEMVRRLNKTGRAPAGFRFALPTEAQWEYACRAGTETAYAFGSELTKREANFGSRQTVAVKSYPPNRWGLYDMHGNVWEWCEDIYGDRLQGGVDPEGGLLGVSRVRRGGSWSFNAIGCRTAGRNGSAPGNRDNILGFRFVVVAETIEPVRRALRVDLKQLEMANKTTEVEPPAEVPSPERRETGEVGKTVDIGLPGGEVMRFCYCPPGDFTMGSPVGEPGHRADENQVSVRISQGFWMAETEVTQGQWQSVMGANPSNFKGVSLPVDSVSWEGAQELVRKLNRTARPPSGFRFALPTEAEWEYACRAGTKTAYAFGSQITDRDAVFGLQQTVPVKSYRPNRWGLYDMHGNVWEWCGDWYGERRSGGVDPKGVSSGVYRVFRGGGWGIGAVDCRAARRMGGEPGLRFIRLGFRPALVPSR